MPYTHIQEGSVNILTPKVARPEEGEVFYNPEMAFDRNISVAAASVADAFTELPKSKMRVCDLLAATGVRALRYAKESGFADVTANDSHEKAAAVMRENAKQNGVALNVTNTDGKLLLAKEHFDFIDIDPFGSPIEFVSNAVRSFSFRGFLAFTATDLGPLVGSYPDVCRRRYGLRSLYTDYNRELGLRILITAVMRKFFEAEKTIVPLFAYARRHYFRVYSKVRYGNKNVNAALRDFGYVSHCFACGWRSLGLHTACEACKSKTEFIGEIYLGDLHAQEFCTLAADELWKRGFSNEAHFVTETGHEPQFPFYYDTHYISEKFKISAPSIEAVCSALAEEGYKCGSTHFLRTAIKTNAPFDEVVKAVKLSV
ncbi:MAG: methyltransferase [Candidatus Aenigmatarchaeota archaeon]|nr:MAG: methyltransferase [Candidatus Aenigmarchaeota archaeon]